MHHGWLYCVGAGLLGATLIGGTIAVLVGGMVLWFMMWEKLSNMNEDAPLYAVFSLIFIVLSIIGTLVCKGVIK